MKESMPYIVIPKYKEEYGPILSSLLLGGAKLKNVDEVEKEDEIIIFYNKPLKIEAKKIGWYMNDLREPFGEGRFDIIYLCNKEYIEEYEKYFDTRVEYLPQCGDDRPIKEGAYHDVVFIGNFNSKYHYNRGEVLEQISENFKLKLVTGQPYTLESKHWYRDIPISLAISPPAQAYTSNRLYNILSSGGFCLTAYYPKIEEAFENKKHLVWFRTPEEAVKLIRYYLDHPEERKKIAQQGHQLYLDRHTGKHRLDFMFEKFVELKK